QLLMQQLREIPAPPPAAGFADRVLTGARRTQRDLPSRAGYALAACLALGLGLVALWQAPVSFFRSSAMRVVTVPPDEGRPVRLGFTSPEALSGVTMHVGLPAGVEIAGYPGERELDWQTNLKQGANLLELPVVAHGSGGGILTASLSHGAEHRDFSVVVKV